MRREYKGRAAQVVTALLAAMILFQLLYVSGSLDRLAAVLWWKWLVIPSVAFRSIHVGLAGTIAFLLYGATRKSPADRLPWYDLLLIALALGSNIYFAVFYDEVVAHSSMGYSTTTELILGLVVIAVMVEATRRVMGIWMPLLAMIFFVYPFIGHLLPDFLHTRAFSLDNVIRHAGPSSRGIYGEMMKVSATVLIAFLLFAQVLDKTKAGSFFTNVAVGLFGRLSGGPALASVGASAAFGSIASNVVANVASTGVITIPLMKSTGMTPRFAAAVESVASNGGHILPPVMASTAFLMAEFLGIDYWQICIAALVPGILYYVALWAAVYLQARRLGIQGLPRSQMPSVMKALASGWQFLLPVVVLLFFLGYLHYSPETSAIYATLALIAVSMFRKDTRLSWHRFVDALAGTARVMVLVTPLFALASVMVAGLDFTGLAFRLSTGLVDISGGNTFVLLLLAAAASIVLGMPLSATATYIILAVLVAPALGTLGVPPIAAHLFLLWFAMAGPITPPSCGACFVAAGIAGGGVSGFSVGWTSMRLAMIIYILPFTFIYQPALLMMGGWVEIVLAAITATIGVTLLAAGMQGWLMSKIDFLTRILLMAAGIMLIWPGLITDGIGLAVAVPVVAYQLLRIRRQRQELGREVVP